MRGGEGPHLRGMHPPIFVRELGAAERAQLEASLRAPSAFTVRRAQIVLLSAAGRRPSQIAPGLCCAAQTVRDGIRAFNASGLAALSAGSSRPRSAAPVLDGAKRQRLRVLLHQSPRAFGQPRSTRTPAAVSRVVVQARKAQVPALTGRPATKRSSIRSPAGRPGSHRP